MTSRTESKVYNRIIHAATGVFASKGIKDTTMEDIAQAIGKGKSTLYYYFTSKETLFEAVLQQEIKKLIRELRIAINQEQTAKEKLKVLAQVYLTAVLRYHTLEKVLQEEIFDSIRGVESIKESFESTLYQMVQEIIRGGIQEHTFRNLSPQTINKISFITVTIFKGLQLPSYLPEQFDVHSEVYFDTLIDLLVEGIGEGGL